ncbi:MAG: hypothetical protein ACLQJR_20460 [Stellaceae bacterium]
MHVAVKDEEQQKSPALFGISRFFGLPTSGVADRRAACRRGDGVPGRRSIGSRQRALPPAGDDGARKKDRQRQH